MCEVANFVSSFVDLIRWAPGRRQETGTYSSRAEDLDAVILAECCCCYFSLRNARRDNRLLKMIPKKHSDNTF